jgi:hypothetical protein
MAQIHTENPLSYVELERSRGTQASPCRPVVDTEKVMQQRAITKTTGSLDVYSFAIAAFKVHVLTLRRATMRVMVAFTFTGRVSATACELGSATASMECVSDDPRF